jgi:phenylacetate-CoA ligase
MRIYRKWVVEAFQPGHFEKDRVQRLLKRIRPRVVEGYVTDLLSLVEGCDLSSAGVRAVFTTGEMLYADQKGILENAFGAPVYSYYGSNEVAGLAFMCEEGSSHITDEHVVLEAVNEANEQVWDEPGRLLVTDLDNHAMPLIRYELGDIGVLSREHCACGRHLLVLKNLLGREQDCLQNKDGEKLSATFFAGRFRDMRGIGRFQLIQDTPQHIRLLYEGTPDACREDLDAIVSEIWARLGCGMLVETTNVDSVSLTPTGKRPLIRGMGSGA